MLSIPATSDIHSPAYQEMQTFMGPYRAAVAENWGTVVCAVAAAMPRNSPQLHGFVTSAVREHYNQLNPEAPIDVFFIKASLFRTGLPEGKLTRQRFAELLPTDYTLVTFEATGRDLLPLLEFLATADGAYPFSNAQLVHSADGLEASIDGQPLGMTRTYRLATDDYLASGILPLLNVYPEKHDTGLLIRDLIIEGAKALAEGNQGWLP